MTILLPAIRLLQNIVLYKVLLVEEGVSDRPPRAVGKRDPAWGGRSGPPAENTPAYSPIVSAFISFYWEN